MKIHFIGIGGIGVSALAQYYLSKGARVSGSDLVESETTTLLKAEGVRLLPGRHKAENLPKDADLVIYSPAVKSNNPELQKAKEQGIARKSYPQALGDLTKQYFTIAVSGAHGKSTTSSMIALILIKAGLDPTVIIGTKLKEFNNSNFRAGESKYLIIEADEWDKSFLNYWPKIIILTNIEKEHMDTYKDMADILKTYSQYIGHLEQGGVLAVNTDDKNIGQILQNIEKPVIKAAKRGKGPQILKYSLKQNEAGQIKNVLQIPGEHNILNGLAALTIARALGIDDKTTLGALGQYQGAWRRFEETKINLKNNDASGCGGVERSCGRKVVVIEDYAHHPTEINATLKAVKEKYPIQALWCVFQPHQYQRTFYLFNDFVKVFVENPLTKLIITDIYDVAGRETKDITDKVSAQKLIQKINKPWAQYTAQNKITAELQKQLKGGEIVVIMGAGNIYDTGQQLIKELSTGRSLTKKK